ncbi:hypothetical protein D9M72_546380 [compost metagenome]
MPAGRTKLKPVPATQVVPPSVLYSQVAPASMPVTLMVPSLVMPSVAEAPVSLAKAAPGAATAVSSVTASGVLLALTLPAASIWRS